MQLEVGMVFEGKVTGITKFGAFVELPGGETGMVHISEVAPTFVKEIRDFITENQQVKVKVIGVGDGTKVSLSMKKIIEESQLASRSVQRVQRAPRRSNSDWQPGNRANDSLSFEDMMSKFKKTSDEKMSDLKKVTENKRGGFSKRGQSK